jgi:GNAT superfamily N-acetyltransferase
MLPRDRFASRRSLRITIATHSSVASNHLIVTSRSHAGQDARKKMAAPFVLVPPDGASGGYYTLAATGVKLAEFPVDITRKLPRYPLVPATLLGRLAVDQNYQRRGYGRFLLAGALFRSVRSEIASFAVMSTPRMRRRAASMSARVSCLFRSSRSSCSGRWRIWRSSSRGSAREIMQDASFERCLAEEAIEDIRGTEKLDPKWAAPIPPCPKGHNHCAELLGDCA